MQHKNKVYLVGAGPGDPELLTVKALRLIESADIIVHDRLISPEILALIPNSVPSVYVGKISGNHSLPQPQINDLLIRLARQHQKVIRLKGGDPYIFGRGGEEVLALAAENIDFEVIPGITAAQACSVYSGIPLTHRGVARSVKFVTGHWQEHDALALDKAALADPQQTLVFYMGLHNLPLIIDDLLKAGRSLDTPAAIIESGSTAKQRNFRSTLADLVVVTEEYAIKPPAIIFIGDVVNLADNLQWFQPVFEFSSASTEDGTRYVQA